VNLSAIIKNFWWSVQLQIYEIRKISSGQLLQTIWFSLKSVTSFTSMDMVRRLALTAIWVQS